jgi:hypothetical protein
MRCLKTPHVYYTRYKYHTNNTQVIAAVKDSSIELVMEVNLHKQARAFMALAEGVGCNKKPHYF